MWERWHDASGTLVFYDWKCGWLWVGKLFCFTFVIPTLFFSCHLYEARQARKICVLMFICTLHTFECISSKFLFLRLEDVRLLKETRSAHMAMYVEYHWKTSHSQFCILCFLNFQIASYPGKKIGFGDESMPRRQQKPILKMLESVTLFQTIL